MEKTNPHFRLVATMTDMAQSSQSWSGETGIIDADYVKRATATLPAPIFYLCGPPGMVEAMRTMLTEAGYDEDDVRSEEFYGY